MYQIQDDKGNISIKLESQKEAIKAYEEWKEHYMSEGVDNESYVQLVLLDSISEEDIIIRKSTIVEDEDLYKEIGSPSDNGYDFLFWATWQEYNIADLINEVSDDYKC